MSRQKILVALGLPLGSTGLLAAHALAYRLVAPAGAGDAHAYLGVVHPLATLGVAAVLVALALEAAGARRGERRAAPSARTFLVVLPLAFAVQEHVERLVAHEPPPTLEPVFLVGLALQVPFALACWLAARALLRVAGRAGEACSRRSSAPALVATLAAVRAAPSGLPPGLLSARRPRGRAPPAPAVG